MCEAETARDAILLEMGYPSFKDYIESELFEFIAHRVLVRAKGVCEVCRLTKAKHIVFKSYGKTVLFGRHINRLSALCAECRDLGSFDFNGKRLSLPERNKRLLALKRGATERHISSGNCCIKCLAFLPGKRRQLCSKCLRNGKPVQKR